MTKAATIPSSVSVDDTVWHIAYTNPRSEISAAIRLAAAGYRAFAPHYYITKPRDHKAPHIRHRVRRQAFTRYVFFGVINPDQGLYAAANCVGVHSMLMNGDAPAIVSSRFMARLMARCEPDGWMRSADDNPYLTEEFEAGQRVKITFGPMEGLIVQIARLDGRDVAEVELEMFGSRRTARVATSGLTAVEA